MTSESLRQILRVKKYGIKENRKTHNIKIYNTISSIDFDYFTKISTNPVVLIIIIIVMILYYFLLLVYKQDYL